MWQRWGLRLVWVLGLALYKIMEDWALDWFRNTMGLGTTAFARILGYIPIFTWILAAAGLIWITTRLRPQPQTAGAQPEAAGIVFADGLEWYESREVLSKLRTVQDQLQSAHVVWALWNTGTRAYVEDATRTGTLKKLLLPDPEDPSLPAFADSDGTSIAGIKTNIYDLTRDAKARGIEVRWLSGPPGNTMMIGDPDAAESWIHLECFQAGVPSIRRPSFRIRRRQFQRLYDALLEGYRNLWTRSQEPPEHRATPSPRTVILCDPDSREWWFENIVDSSEEQKRRLMTERPDVWRAYKQELSNRMRIPGKPGEPWPDPPIVESDRTVDQMKRQTAKWRSQYYVVVRSDGTRETITAGHLLDLPTESRHKLLRQYPELGAWWRSLA